jgi:hypothetical protein
MCEQREGCIIDENISAAVYVRMSVHGSNQDVPAQTAARDMLMIGTATRSSAADGACSNRTTIWPDRRT